MLVRVPPGARVLILTKYRYKGGMLILSRGIYKLNDFFFQMRRNERKRTIYLLNWVGFVKLRPLLQGTL